MATFFEAIEAITPENINQTEEVSILDALNRVLAVDIVSNIDFPLFNKATMDGFAFKFSDVDETLTLKIKDSVYAGSDKAVQILQKECVRIMTGAKVPDCCDSIVEFEVVEEKDGCITFKKSPKKGSNIAYFAEDLKKGDVVFRKGTLIKTNMINVIAQLGYKTITVYRKLNIGVITTGDELVEIGEPLNAASVVDTSRYSLLAQIKQFNQEAIDYGKIPDDLRMIEDTLRTAVSHCDIVIVTGGSSFGDKDYTSQALSNINAQTLIRTIDMKPGRPTIIAKKDNCYIVGSPGNPVSTFSVFKLFVGNTISKMLGCMDFDVKYLRCQIGFDYSKKKDRMHFLPVNIKFENDGFIAYKIHYNGSGDFNALSKANAFLVVPKQTETAKKGDKCEFFFI